MYEAIILALGNHLLKIQYCFDWSDINLIYTLLMTRSATNISISLTIFFVLLRGQR